MAVELIVPHLGHLIKEARIGNWLKKQGEWVSRDENILIIQTGMSTMDVPAPSSGLLANILCGPGERVSVGAVIARINPDAKSLSMEAEASPQTTQKPQTVGLRIPSMAERSNEVEITKWLKHEGDSVVKGEVVLIVESNKSVTEILAPCAGILEKIAHQVGNVVKIGDAVAYIGPHGNTQSRPQPGKVPKPSELSISNRPSTAKRTGNAPPEPANQKPESRTKSLIGETINRRFLVQEEIGRGGMGVVYLVKDKYASDQLRALKVMSRDLPEGDMKRFTSEGKARKLKHEHIVETIDQAYCDTHNLYFITMEFVEGKSLRDHIDEDENRRPFDLIQSLELTRQLLHALSYLNLHPDGKLVHRDVKPSNLRVFQDKHGRWQLKLLDFGLALLDLEASRSSKGIVGTFEYMSPEQLAGKAATHQSDLFSATIVLYELLTGKFPKGIFNRVYDAEPDIAAEIDRIIENGLQQELEKRSRDARFVLAEIERILKLLQHPLQPLDSNPAGVRLSESEDYGRLIIQISNSRSPQINLPGVPPIPEEILELKGLQDSISQAIRLLIADTHPDLEKYQQTHRNLEELLEAHRQDLEVNTPVELSTGLREKLGELLEADPHTTNLTAFIDIAPDVSATVLWGYVGRRRSVIRTGRELKLKLEAYETEKRDETTRLQLELVDLTNRLNELRELDFHAVLGSFMDRQDLDEDIPVQAWAEFIDKVLKHRMLHLNNRQMTLAFEEEFRRRVAGSKAKFHRKTKTAVGPPDLLVTPFSETEVQSCRQAWSDYSNHDIALTTPSGSRLLLIPAGRFAMGASANLDDLKKKVKSDTSSWNFEYPPHEVTISKPYFIGEHSVTVADFRYFVEKTKYVTEAEKTGAGLVLDAALRRWQRRKGCYWGKPGYDQTDRHPVVLINFHDACAYCDWLSTEIGHLCRLPSEAEWEYAAGAGCHGLYFHGDDWTCLGKYAVVITGLKCLAAAPVGTCLPNNFGLFDVIGNTWEWCRDWFDPEYYEESPLVDPTGPITGGRRVLRGGSFLTDASIARLSRRFEQDPSHSDAATGFRIVCECE